MHVPTSLSPIEHLSLTVSDALFLHNKLATCAYAKLARAAWAGPSSNGPASVWSKNDAVSEAGQDLVR